MQAYRQAEGRTANDTPWRIRYQVTGQGPDLLLLHGAGPGATGAGNFSKNIEALSRRFRCLTIDFPGFGGSSKNLGDFGEAGPFQNAGKAVLAFMDALGLRRVRVIGTSLGASAALCLAMDHAERVERLVLVAPGGGVVDGATAPTEAVRQLFAYYEGEGPSRAKMAAFLQHLVHDRSLLTPELVEQRFLSSIDPEIVASPPLSLPPGGPGKELFISLDPRLASLRTRSLFVWGLQDACNPVDGLAPFKAMPDADFLLLANCGHWPHWEHPAAFNSLAERFLQSD